MMTREKFLETVRQAKIRSDAFDLKGSGNERYVLSSSKNNWTVYYSERGLQTGARNFSSEPEALEYLLEVLKRDPTTRL